jgi:electron transport complex protein RnfB
MNDVYERLREHLDKLPGGFPATETGVELRILKRLFTAEDAELAQHLILKLEPATVISERAGISVEDAAERLRWLEKD